MKNLSSSAKVYILGTILIGIGLTTWAVLGLDWTEPGLYLAAIFGAAAQTLKVEGPNDRTNYSIAWFVYGFTFVAYGLEAAVIIIVVAHLVEWIWHKYPWYIQSFNIGNHVLSIYLAGMAFEFISRGMKAPAPNGVLGLIVASLIFVFGNHLLVGVVVKLARNQSFAESGVFGFLTLFLDFTVLSMGVVTALIWASSPFAAVLNILPLYLLYQALRVPRLLRQVQELKK